MEKQKQKLRLHPEPNNPYVAGHCFYGSVARASKSLGKYPHRLGPITCSSRARAIWGLGCLIWMRVMNRGLFPFSLLMGIDKVYLWWWFLGYRGVVALCFLFAIWKGPGGA